LTNSDIKCFVVDVSSETGTLVRVAEFSSEWLRFRSAGHALNTGHASNTGHSSNGGPHRKASTLALLLAIASVSLPARAALYDRGDGMIYDDVLDITWLQDTNYVVTSGYAAANVSPEVTLEGAMDWWAAKEWVDQLDYGGFEDWRLPSVREITDQGYNITTGELGYMFYVNLGGQAHSDAGCSPNCLGDGSFVDGETGMTLSFINIIYGQPLTYWYAEELPDDTNFALVLHYTKGVQSGDAKAIAGDWAWAVRDGDVTDVPEPHVTWLYGAAFLVLCALKQMRRAEESSTR
jgi:hypothetical protein